MAVRQTPLSLEQIVNGIDTPTREYPPCLLVNELGEVAKAGDQSALNKLKELLGNKTEELRAISYLWLTIIEGSQEPELVAFGRRPENVWIVAWAQGKKLQSPA